METGHVFSRRRWCGAVVGSLLAGPVLAQTRVPDIALPRAASLSQAMAEAAARHKALIVMASLEGCGFCRIARSLYLGPLHQAGQPIVQLDMKTAAAVADFQGRQSTHDELLKRWGVKVAPTLLFFGPGGRELAERMEGAGLPDFYGAYLEERTQQANAHV